MITAAAASPWPNDVRFWPRGSSSSLKKKKKGNSRKGYASDVHAEERGGTLIRYFDSKLEPVIMFTITGVCSIVCYCRHIQLEVGDNDLTE